MRLIQLRSFVGAGVTGLAWGLLAAASLEAVEVGGRSAALAGAFPALFDAAGLGTVFGGAGLGVDEEEKT